MQAFKLKKLKRVHGLHFAADGRRLLAVGGSEVRMVDACVWLDLATGENAGRIEQYAAAYAVDPGASRYLLVDADQWHGLGKLQWTPLTGPAEWHKIGDVRGQVSGAAFDPTGARLVVATQRGLPRKAGETDKRFLHEIHFIGLEPGAEATRCEVEDWGQILAFNADGTRLAIGGLDRRPSADVYDLVTQRRVFRFQPPGTVTRGALFLPGNRFAVANGRNVYVLPADGGEPLLTVAGHPKQVNAISLTPDGRRLLTASHDGSIRLWDSVTGDAGPSFDWQIGSVTAVAFSPDGLTCAAAGLGGRIVIWDVDP